MIEPRDDQEDGIEALFIHVAADVLEPGDPCKPLLHAGRVPKTRNGVGVAIFLAPLIDMVAEVELVYNQLCCGEILCHVIGVLLVVCH